MRKGFIALTGLVVLSHGAEMNPVRKVVNLLQAMQKKVTAEGVKEKELYQKFMCYCQSGAGDLSASIGAAETKAPAVTSSIDAAESKLAQTKADLKQAQSDRSAAKEAMAEATTLRGKEASTYASAKSDYDTNIAAIAKAVAALEKGMAGGFLQTQAAEVLRRLAVSKQDMLDMERQELLAFLSGTHGVGYAPSSGEITGILKEMGDTMAKSLADITGEEKDAIKSYGELIKAKKKEVAALTAAIESKTKQIGDLGVSIVQMKEDLSDTEAALAADRKFLANLQKSCSTKTAEWDERSKTRADELVALADTIKVLNDDDALELFKKTLPSASASFMQVRSAGQVRAQARTILSTARGRADPKARVGLDFLMLALTGRKAMSKGGFDSVIKMVDNLVALLKKEQNDDNDKKEYCSLQLDQADDKKKATERSLEGLENAIATATEASNTMKDEIKALEVGIKELDKSVMDATEQRKAENSEYKELMASDASAKQVLQWAKNRLNKFYNPKMYKPPAKRELSAQDRITENMGIEVPTEAPGGIAGSGVGMLVQISEHQQHKDAPAPPPETWGAYSTKSEENAGVLSMMDLLIRDLDKEMTEAETEEKASQADYEIMMKESAAKRSSDAASLQGKVAMLANTEQELVELHEGKKATGRELMATMKFTSSLHAECDWLLQYFDVRKEARAGEVDALIKAKAVLSGADFSMLQTHSQGFLARSG